MLDLSSSGRLGRRVSPPDPEAGEGGAAAGRGRGPAAQPCRGRAGCGVGAGGGGTTVVRSGPTTAGNEERLVVRQEPQRRGLRMRAMVGRRWECAWRIVD